MFVTHYFALLYSTQYHVDCSSLKDVVRQQSCVRSVQALVVNVNIMNVVLTDGVLDSVELSTVHLHGVLHIH
jgi:hypothetical protein